MKKIFAMLLAFAMLFALTACGAQPAEAPAPAPAEEAAEPAPVEEVAEPEEEVDDTVYTLVASTHTPSTTTMTVVFQNMLDEITARSNGRLQFEVYTDGTLAAADGILEAIESGIADVACINYSRVNGRLDLCGVVSLPGICSNPWEGSKAFFDLYDSSEELRAQFSDNGVHLMGIAMGDGFCVISKDPVTDLADLEGKKVIIGNAQVADIMTQIGATPMNFSNSDAYEMLSKGTADAIASNTISGAAGFGIQEVAKNVYHINLGIGPQVFCISESVYAGLPADLQQIIDDVCREFVPDNVYTVYTLEQGKEVTSMDQFVQAGATIVEPTAEQMAAFREDYATPAWDAWAEAQGEVGATVLADYIAAVATHEGTCPEF